MPARISDGIRERIYDSWVAGGNRYKVAIENGVSESTVTNILRDYRNSEGSHSAEQTRRLSKALSKTGISPDQCAQGHRLLMIMRRIGITNEEDHEKFLKEISTMYLEVGIDPVTLANHIFEYHAFLNSNQGPHGRTSIPQIREIIDAKRSEERVLDEELAKMKSYKKGLQNEITELQFEKLKMESELRWDEELVQTIKTGGFQFETVPKFVAAASLMRDHGYNIFEIEAKYSNLENASDICAEMETRARNAQLEYEKSQEIILRNSVIVNDLKHLGEIGFGLPELRQLKYLVTEIALQNGPISESDAMKNYFDDLRNYFFDYVFLKKKVAELKAEREKLSIGASSQNSNVQDIFKFAPNFASKPSRGGRKRNRDWKTGKNNRRSCK